MGPAERLVAGAVIAGMSVTGFVAGRTLLRPVDRIDQPIAFNHSIHVESLECENCHEYFSGRAHSGLPGISTCMECHEEPLTESAEEQTIRELAEAGQEQVFKKLFRLPDNVFYTHRRHVEVAGLACETCHGPIAETERPPQAPLVAISMDYCVECHERDGVTVECTRCHR